MLGKLSSTCERVERCWSWSHWFENSWQALQQVGMVLIYDLCIAYVMSILLLVFCKQLNSTSVSGCPNACGVTLVHVYTPWSRHHVGDTHQAEHEPSEGIISTSSVQRPVSVSLRNHRALAIAYCRCDCSQIHHAALFALPECTHRADEQRHLQ